MTKNKYIVQVEVSKTYRKEYELTVYAADPDEAETEAIERASEWNSNADDTEINVTSVNED